MEPKKIVLVEDEPDTAKVILKRLITEGYNVMITEDAPQAIRIIHDERPNLVILDLMLPGGGGLTVLQRMKLSTFTVAIPVIVLTGMKDEAYKNKIMAEGVEAYLEKPYEAKELLDTIKCLLENKEKDESANSGAN
ncbi:MAG: response regulator [Candidatus Omnitrophica bacterium]|nr:response regulator [Candidatus Omnitrophota bacterium]